MMRGLWQRCRAETVAVIDVIDRRYSFGISTSATGRQDSGGNYWLD